jgi:hypothetical protein
VFGLRKQRSKKGRRSVLRRKTGKAGRKSEVSVLRSEAGEFLQTAKCVERGCTWPAVECGVCVFHLRDLLETI